MRVALVASLVSPLRPPQANGPHSVIVDLARGLASRGHAVKVYAAAGSGVDGIDVVEIPVDEAAAGAAIRVGLAPSTDATAALNSGFERLFASIRRSAPDVVSQHAFDGAAFDLADGLPTLHTLHLPPLDAEVVAAVRRSEGALTSVSSSARAAWQAATGRDVGVLPNGVRDRTPARGAIVPVALIAGRISPEKGTATAIRVARKAGLAVLVAGDIYDSDYYTDVVQPMLRPREYIGCVSRDELFQLMARCALVLMPVEWDEAFGLVAAEAQMAGCPVVAYRRGALPEVVRHRVGGWLVEPGDEAALAAVVPFARALDRQVIRRNAQRHLGIGRMVDAYEQALHDLAAAPVAVAS